MRHSSLSLVLLSALALPGCSQAPAVDAPGSTPSLREAAPIEPAIEQLERDWVAAIVNKDLETLDRVLAEDFVGASADGTLYSKALAVADLRSGQYVVERMDLTDMTVATYNEKDVAVAFTSQDEVSHYGTVDTGGKYRYMDVWVLRDGRWQVIASHGSKAGSE